MKKVFFLLFLLFGFAIQLCAAEQFVVFQSQEGALPFSNADICLTAQGR